jgi:eukaryotic-like serine/threonine-protein kinase
MTTVPVPVPVRLPWSDIKALFDATADLAPAARTPLLAASGLGGAALLEVQSLLDHHDASTGAAGFMAAPAAHGLAGDSAREEVLHGVHHSVHDSVREGQRLGAWEIVRAIGAGGMGEVFEARRADGQFEGRAAVKLLKRGMDSAVVLQRFALEKQALARLSHPHIAKLLDAGASADGLPYFVLEYIDGKPIDVAAKALPLDARLALFLQLADAVAYAHRNLLVHRDLKPGNVLVDHEGQVKLLDFGIAKALDPLEAVNAADGLHTGLHTMAGQRPFTPHYASPEQVRGEPVSTATDIYSLGVLLYQLLTGTRPTGRKAGTAAEAARSVLEDTPTKPSQLSADEALDPQWLLTRKRLAGDLDNILLKALEKAPELRYASVDAFAADVRAHLQGRPVSARAAQPLYLLGKFMQRNRALVWTGGIAVLGLATALVATLLQGRAAAAAGVAVMGAALLVALLQARSAASARDAATVAAGDARAQLERVKRITTDLVFRYGDTVTHLPGGAQAQEAMLRETVALLEPAVQGSNDADLAATMASALGRLAEIQGANAVAAPERSAEASATAERALALASRAWPERLGDWRFASWTVRTCIVQSQLLRGRGAINEARAVIELAITRATAALALQADGEGHMYMGAGLANAHVELAQVLFHPVIPSFSRSDEALAEYHLAEQTVRALMLRHDDLAMLDRKAPPGSFSNVAYLRYQVGTIMGSRALIYLRTGRVEEALAESAAAVVLRQRNLENEPRHVWWRQGLMAEATTWAHCLMLRGRHAEGLSAATLAWGTMQALAVDEGPQSKWARPATRALVGLPYGWALLAAGRVAEAQAVLEPTLAHWRSQTGAEAEAKTAQVQALLADAQAAVTAMAAAPGH